MDELNINEVYDRALVLRTGKYIGRGPESLWSAILKSKRGDIGGVQPAQAFGIIALLFMAQIPLASIHGERELRDFDERIFDQNTAILNRLDQLESRLIQIGQVTWDERLTTDVPRKRAMPNAANTKSLSSERDEVGSWFPKLIRHTESPKRTIPNWRKSIGAYAPEDLVGVTFESEDHAREADKVIWKLGSETGMPYAVTGERSYVVPAEALVQFKGLEFKVFPVVSGADVSRDERSKLTLSGPDAE